MHYLRRRLDRLRWRLIFKLVPYRSVGSYTVSTIRRWTYRLPLPSHRELSLQIRDTSQPRRHSREELLLMLRAIRREELLTGWTVPEPTVAELSIGEEAQS